MGGKNATTVRYGTARLSSHCHSLDMLHKKITKGLSDNERASLKKEMGLPRMSRSARIAERNLDTSRVAEQPSASMPGTVKKIISSPRANKPEKAQITVDRADPQHRVLRIKNSLVDENGDDVKLKKGERVEVTITADPKRSRAATNK
jgi:hypothetical protein